MTLRPSKRRGLLPRAIMLAVATALVPLPALADDARPTAKPGTIKASVEKISARDFAPAKPAKAVSARLQQEGAGQGASFFKTKPGIVALAVMIGGVGYALYSTQHDRITSPAKK